MKTSLNASTVATVTNLTNAPTNGDLTATMKASIATSVSGVTAAVTAITTNTARGRTVIPDQMELPASGSTSYEINLNIYTLQGAMDAPDSAPTIHVRTVGGASMDASLRSTAMTLISAGVYNVTYSVASTDIQQQILFTFAWAVGGVPFTLTGTTDVVNVYAVAFTSIDRTALNAIPTTPLLTSDTRLNHLNADISAIPIAPLLASDTRLNHLNADISAIPIAPLLAVNYTAPDSASIIATAVWAAGGRTLTSFGTLVADAAAAVWGAVSRTLTAFAFIPTVDKTGYTLDSAQRVKLDASQPDYVPAKESDVTTITTAISNISDPFSEVIPESNPAMTYGQALARLTVPSTLPVIPILALPTTTYQILYGNTKEFAATAWSVGDIATMTISSSQIINGVIIEPAIRTCTLDSTGLFSFTPDIGLTNILITISNFRGIYFSKAISLINTNSSMNISDY
jgi:hypothetical protein